MTLINVFSLFSPCISIEKVLIQFLQGLLPGVVTVYVKEVSLCFFVQIISLKILYHYGEKIKTRTGLKHTCSVNEVYLAR